MDEPLSNLDAKLRVSTRAEIKNLSHALEITTIYVTHDQIEALTLADRIVVMDRGVVQQIGTPAEVYDRPANTFVAGFIGSPAMNLIAGHVAAGTFRAEGIAIPGLNAADGPVTLGFRAEDARLAEAGQAGEVQAPLFAVEHHGDAAMLTLRLGETPVTVKAPKDVAAKIGQPASFRVPPAICHLFDHATGTRLDR